MIKNVLIKVSGDVINSDEFFDFAVDKAKKNYVVVICGAGTKIGKVLEERGYNTRFNEHGRVTKTFEERKIARDVLEYEQRKLQDKFLGKGVDVEIPVIKLGSILCHINGDSYVKASYLGFDEIYVFTLGDRVGKKKNIFNGYPKVKIIGV